MKRLVFVIASCVFIIFSSLRLWYKQSQPRTREAASAATLKTSSWTHSAADNATGTPAESLKNASSNHSAADNSTTSVSASANLSVADASTHRIVQPRLCENGKLLPNLYLLGAQKAGTTELAEAFRHARIFSSLDIATKLDEIGKEQNFWGTMVVEMTEAKHGKEDDRNWTRIIESRWFELWPPCEGRSWGPLNLPDNVTIADMSANNLWMTPTGDGLRASSKHWPPTMSHDTLYLPNQLANLYGSAKQGVTFVVLLREPLSRMQAAYYHTTRGKKTSMFIPQKFHPTFAGELQVALNQYEELHKVTFFLWGSLYGRQLDVWLSYFLAEQFVVIPWKYYLFMDPSAVCSTLWQHLHRRVDCKTHPHFNRRDHASLEEDVPRNTSLWNRAQKILAKENTLLVSVLHTAFHAGASFPAAKFQLGGSLEEVDQWLTSAW